MKKTFCPAAIALLAILLCLFSACGEADPALAETTAVPETTAPPTPLSLVSGGKSEYIIVRGETADDIEVDAAIALYTAFANAGVKVGITTDWEKDGADPAARPKYEILVGHTNREETKTVTDRLLYDAYAVEVVGDKLVICGGGSNTTVEACRAFIETYLAGKVADLSLERTLLLSQQGSTYPVSTVTIGGRDLSEYTIVYTNAIYDDAAFELQQGLIEVCGRQLPVSSMRNVTSPMIVVGMPSAAADIAPCGATVMTLSREGMLHAIEQKDGMLVLAGHTGWTTSDAVYEFLNTYLIGKSGEVAIGEIAAISDMTSSEPLYAEATMRIMTYNVLGVADNHLDRYPYVLAQIRRYMPDILGMQESPKTVHNQVIDAVKDVYAEAHKWHDDADDVVNYTPILYRKDKYKVLESGCIFLRSRYTETNTKSIAWAVFETLDGGAKFIVTNLHGSLIADSYNIPGSNSVEGAAWRVDNVAQMVEKLNELKGKYGDIPTFSTGDFNFNEDAQAYKDAVAAGLSDAEKIASVSRVTGIKTTHTVGQAPAAGKSIDHIFVNDKVSVYVHEVVRDKEALKGSDHCAVYADVKLK